MPTPYEIREPAEAGSSRAGRSPSGAGRSVRPTMVRPRKGRHLAGVCAGLAGHLGLPVGWVRVAFVVLTVAGGAGVVAYIFLWVLVPEDDGAVQAVPARWLLPDSGPVAQRPTGSRPPMDPAQAVAGPSTGPPSPPVAGSGRVTAGSSDDASDGFELRGGALMVVGGLVALAGLVLGVRALGVAVPTGLVVPVLVVGVGAVIAWSQLDDAQRSRWLGTESGRRGPGVARLVLGLLLAAVGIVALVLRGRSLTDVWDALLATLAVLVGVGLIAAPWVVRLWGDLRAEQVEAARARERADIAAHLHDSVLQTLALIQRRSDDPHTVSQLARAQERELRAYLYAGPTGSQATLAAALTEVAHDVEDVHGIPVDLVVTGDGPLDESSQALVRAFREALLNAVRHGRPPVTAYAEVGASGVEAFVRDHGDGFDLDAVPEDRLGVRESILGRMERHGGRATVRLLDQGTEVALTLPPTQTPASSVTQTRPAAPAQTPGQSATQTRPPATVAPAPSATHTSAPPATRSPAPSATHRPAGHPYLGPAGHPYLGTAGHPDPAIDSRPGPATEGSAMTTPPIRLVLVDDHRMFRTGVKAELAEVSAAASGLRSVEFAGEAPDVDTAVAVVREQRPDVVLLDVHLPGGRGNGGVDVLHGCAGAQAASGEPVRFLALSVSDAAEDVIAVIRAGARGYVTKTISGTDLLTAIRRVADGDAVFSPRLAGFVLDAFGAAAGEIAEVDEELDRLSAREREVMRLIARGYQYKEVAKELFISVKTVETHVSSVLRKLQLSNRHELTAWAMGRRLL